MACDYPSIRADNEQRYGTDIGRIGPMLLADRYDDRAHFIFEILQNAEDALARRRAWSGSRAVSFHLTDKALRVSHFGQPFDEDDVRGICGIATTTKPAKDITAIGRFGIGFKSVYAICRRPEVHSGAEDFAIESFVWPVATGPISRKADETVILLPLDPSDAATHVDIERGLKGLGASVLLFLRQITEIDWHVDGGASGVYSRGSEKIDTAVRRVSVVGQTQGEAEVDETWLTFSRPVSTDEGRLAGKAEIAFECGKDGQHEAIRPLEAPPLVVFFPTAIQTHLGFLVQGPYRTTPSRDNVPRNDAWNQHLVAETATLLVEALRWLRDHSLLDTETLRCLPLDPDKFGEAAMFVPLFRATKEALASEPLLPRFDTGYIPATRARLARTQELREIFTPSQLASLLGEQDDVAWLSADITAVRNPELRRYLMQELDVVELSPDDVIPKLGKLFLEAQSDAWILKLYEFLNGQPALRRRLDGLPLIRLEDGTHVCSGSTGQPQAFLPGPVGSEFPTVRPAVCTTEGARGFLESLGLTEPEPVDEVIQKVLPKYAGDGVPVSDADYKADIGRIVVAFGTDSKQQKERLLGVLRETRFVMAVDAGDGSKRLAKPGEVYLASERLQELFAGVASVLLVDSTRACLRGEEVRDLLETSGATRCLRPIPTETKLTRSQLAEIRRNAGLERSSWGNAIADKTLRGLDALLKLLPRLSPEVRVRRSRLLWEALIDLESRLRSQPFLVEYRWGYFHETGRADVDADFVRQLAGVPWVPDANRDLQRPEFVLFDSLAWESNPFLLSKIRFKPPVLDQLAEVAGIEPGVLDLLKQHGLTSVADLEARLGVPKASRPDEAIRNPGSVDQAIRAILGDAPPPTPPVTEAAHAEPPARHGSVEGGDAQGPGFGAGPRDRAATRSPGSAAGRPFISYVGAHPEEDGPDADALDHNARMELEQRAINFIVAREPVWQRTPTHNPGYDLVELGEDARPARFCEVKAMTGTWGGRPVGLSRTQFECARQHGDAYWLYVVERAGEAHARIVRIQDPAGKARTFTFDHGWLEVADVTAEDEHRED